MEGGGDWLDLSQDQGRGRWGGEGFPPAASAGRDNRPKRPPGPPRPLGGKCPFRQFSHDEAEVEREDAAEVAFVVIDPAAQGGAPHLPSNLFKALTPPSPSTDLANCLALPLVF